jgi:replication factor A1
VINDERMFYLGCPECRKKVIEEVAGYRCENCNKVQTQCVPTYMLSAKMNDLSGSTFMTFPKELGDVIMNGQSADEFRRFKEECTNNNKARMEENEEIRDFFYEASY